MSVSVAAAGMPPVVARYGRRGLRLPLDAFRQRLGGEPLLRRVLAALTVTERPHPGRPRGMGATVRRAYLADRAADSLWIPRVRLAPLLAARTREGRPIVDAVADDTAPDNAPLPAPRRFPAAAAVASEPLYEYQEAAVAHLLGEAGPLGAAAVRARAATCYLQMDTGLGKSRVGLAVAAARGEPALVVVPTDAIAGQWIEELGELYPALRGAIYRNPPKGSKRVPPGPQTHDVVVIIINTFRDKTPDFLEGYGTILLDEAHEYHSECNGRALWLAQTRAVLALSATPVERKDGLDLVCCLHLGAVLYPRDIPGFDVNAVNFRGQVRLVEYAGPPEFAETVLTPAGSMSAILTIGNIIRDPARLRLVAAETRRLFRLHEELPPAELARLGLGPRPPEAARPGYPAGEVRRHGVFVFAEHRNYLPLLRDALLQVFSEDELVVPQLAPGAEADADEDEDPGDGDGDAADTGAGVGAAAAPTPSINILRGGVARNAVGDARAARACVVLTTYGYSRRGISLPDQTATVYATPRRNGMRQIMGRILRRGSDESIIRQVVDVVDVCTGLKGQLTDRKKIYREKGYPMTVWKTSHLDWAGAVPPAVVDGEGDADAAEEDLGGWTVDELVAELERYTEEIAGEVPDPAVAATS